MTTSTSTNDSTLSRLRFAITSSTSWATVSLVGLGNVKDRIVATTGQLQVPAVDANVPTVATWGFGTAIVDFVANAPVGVQPTLSICKSDGGTVQVAVTRTTYGATPIAGVTDYRSDNSSTAGCHDQLTSPVSVDSVLGPTAWPPLLDSRRLVLAFYYPWFDSTTFNQGAWVDKPTGPFDTGNPAQVQAMVNEAAGSGINGFIVSYNGFTGLLPRVQAVVTAAASQPGFQVSALAELDNLAGPDGTVSATSLEGWFQGILPLTAAPSWLRVAGRPVVFLFSQWRVSPSTWNSVRAWLAAQGQDPFMMGQAVDPSFPVDGLYQYTPNVVTDPSQLHAWDESWQYQARLKTALDDVPQQVLWAAPVSPGQNNALLGLPASETLIIQRANGARYDASWQAALSTRPEWSLVSTWNEFYETTQVAPSTPDGSLALSQTRSWATQFAGLN